MIHITVYGCFSHLTSQLMHHVPTSLLQRDHVVMTAGKHWENVKGFSVGIPYSCTKVFSSVLFILLTRPCRCPFRFILLLQLHVDVVTLHRIDVDCSLFWIYALGRMFFLQIMTSIAPSNDFPSKCTTMF